jgi:hypothetical protein
MLQTAKRMAQLEDMRRNDDVQKKDVLAFLQKKDILDRQKLSGSAGADEAREWTHVEDKDKGFTASGEAIQ